METKMSKIKISAYPPLIKSRGFTDWHANFLIGEKMCVVYSTTKEKVIQKARRYIARAEKKGAV